MTDSVETVLKWMREGKVDQANQSFATLSAAMQTITDPETWAQAAYTFQEAGFIPYALALYDQAQEHFPNDQRWTLLKAEAWMADGDFDQALDQLLTIATTSPYYVETLLLQADAYQGLHFPEMSELKLKEAADLAPDEPAITLGLAELNYAEGRFKEALPYYQRLLADEDNLDRTAMKVATEHYHYALGASGDFEGALDALEAIPESERTQSDIEQMAVDYVETKDFEKAHTLMEPLYVEGELAPGLLPLYAEVLTQQHDEVGAIHVLDEAITKDPIQLPLYEKRAQLYIARHEDELAIADLQWVLAEDDEAITARLLLLRLLVRLERVDEAKSVLEATPETIQDGEFDWLAARIYDLDEDYEKAEAAYRRAYPELKWDDSFMSDYLTFEREDGHLDMIQQAFLERPELKDNPDFHWLYNEALGQADWED